MSLKDELIKGAAKAAIKSGAVDKVVTSQLKKKAEQSGNAVLIAAANSKTAEKVTHEVLKTVADNDKALDAALKLLGQKKKS